MEEVNPRSFPAFTVLFFSGFLVFNGCRFFSDSFETAATLDRSGRAAEAIRAYQTYLDHHPGTALAARIDYRIAKNFEAQGDYTQAIQWYEKIPAQFPDTDEELHALLDLASLYHDQLKDPAKAVDYDRRAFTRYMENTRIRDAVQALIDAEYQTATALFLRKDYQGALGVLDGVGVSYPAVFIRPDAMARVDALKDRARRAAGIARASVDLLFVRDEEPFNKSYEADFPAEDEEEGVIPSPDGSRLAERRKAANGVDYLYVAKVPLQGDKALFTLLPQTFGAQIPAWSPDGQDLVYWRIQRGLRKLEKTDVKTRQTRTLFYTQSKSLGIHPAYHPAGNKIAYVYEGRVCLINTDGPTYKTLLKTKQRLDYTAELSWSTDGTMIRCRQSLKNGKFLDDLLVLDVAATNNP